MARNILRETTEVLDGVTIITDCLMIAIAEDGTDRQIGKWHDWKNNITYIWKGLIADLTSATEKDDPNWSVE